MDSTATSFEETMPSSGRPVYLLAYHLDNAGGSAAEQMKMLEWAGVNFGEDNVYILQKSLKKLAVLSGASSVMFFGKIFGTEKYYWIA